MAKVRKTWNRKEISLETKLALLRVCVFMSCTLVKHVETIKDRVA